MATTLNSDSGTVLPKMNIQTFVSPSSFFIMKCRLEILLKLSCV